MLNVIFDTNSIYYLDTTNKNNTGEHLSINEYEILKENVKNGNLNIYISWLSMIEVSYHLKNQPQDLQTIQNGIKNLLTLKPYFLPDPETMFTEYIQGKKTSNNHRSIIAVRNICQTISCAQNIMEMEEGFCNLEFSTEAYKRQGHYIDKVNRKINFGLIIKERTEYEDQFLADIRRVLQILKNIFPSHATKISRGRQVCLTVTEQDQMFANDGYISELKRGIENRGAATLSPIQSEEVKTMEKFDYWHNGYKAFLVTRVLENKKRNIDKNDYNDLHFLVYFNKYNDYIFITSEKKQVVFSELRSSDRCLTIKQLSNKLINK